VGAKRYDDTSLTILFFVRAIALIGSGTPSVLSAHLQPPPLLLKTHIDTLTARGLRPLNVIIEIPRGLLWDEQQCLELDISLCLEVNTRKGVLKVLC
jgi:hypothetical protein